MGQVPAGRKAPGAEGRGRWGQAAAGNQGGHLSREREGLQETVASSTWEQESLWSAPCWGPRPGNLQLRCSLEGGREEGRQATRPLSAQSRQARPGLQGGHTGIGGGGGTTPALQRSGRETEFLSLWSHLRGWIQRTGSQGCGWRWPESVCSPPTSLFCPSGVCGKRGRSCPGAPRSSLLSQPGMSVSEVGGVSHLLLASATRAPSVGFPSYQLYPDGRFLGHHGLGWGFREPSGLWQGKMKGLGSAHVLETLSCLWTCPGSPRPWLMAGFLCRRLV